MTRKIVIPLDAPALARGVGFFETLLVVRGRPVLIREHFERMEHGVRSIDFPAPEWREFEREADKVARDVAHLDEGSIRLSWLAVNGEIESRASWKLVGVSGPISEATLRRRRRGRVITLDSHLGRTSPELKSVSYIPSVLGLREAMRRDADEALFVDEKRRVLEGTTSNVFAVQDDRLLTPPVSAGLLPGVTRRWVVENAPRLGLEVRERLLTRKDLLAGAFLTGSLTCFARIRVLDGQKCAPPGPALRRLERLFEREVTGSGG